MKQAIGGTIKSRNWPFIGCEDKAKQDIGLRHTYCLRHQERYSARVSGSSHEAP